MAPIRQVEIDVEVVSLDQVDRDGKVSVDTGDFLVPIPDDKQGIYRPHLGKEIVFGMRPEDIEDPQYCAPGIQETCVEARVTVTELMGNEVVVYLETDNHEFLGRFDPRTAVSVGQMATPAFNMANMHIFDKETELVIR